MILTKSYQSKINKVLRHIDNKLGEEIIVKDLADISGFSLYHFHRIFKAITNESPYDSLLRLRLEKAVYLLKYKPNLSISEVGYDSGFSAPENFARQFKTRFKISPSAYRKDKNLHNSRIYQESNPDDFYIRIENSRKLKKIDFSVEIESLPKMSIAYTKAVFGADGTGMVDKYLELMNWAKQNNVNTKGELTRFGMSIDNPEVTPASKFRYDFALKLDKTYPKMEGIEFGFIPQSNFATVHVQGNLENVAQAWDYLYQTWLPASEFIPVHYPAIEEFLEGPEEIGWERFNLKCRIPVTTQ